MNSISMWYTFKNEGISYYNDITDFPDGSFGFIYKITHKESKRYYIGKKFLYSETNVKLGVKETKNLPIQRGRKPTKKKVIKESNWKDYWGSNKEFLEYKKNKQDDEFKREILHICNSKLELTYWETHYLFINSVLFDDLSYNSNILGKFYKGKLEE